MKQTGRDIKLKKFNEKKSKYIIFRCDSKTIKKGRNKKIS